MSCTCHAVSISLLCYSRLFLTVGIRGQRKWVEMRRKVQFWKTDNDRKRKLNSATITRGYLDHKTKNPAGSKPTHRKNKTMRGAGESKDWKYEAKCKIKEVKEAETVGLDSQKMWHIVVTLFPPPPHQNHQMVSASKCRLKTISLLRVLRTCPQVNCEGHWPKNTFWF